MPSNDLRNILACPVCKGALEPRDGGERLCCRTCGRNYPVREGIPILLPDEADDAADHP